MHTAEGSYLAEDDSLANSDAAVDIAQGFVLIFLILTHKIVLPDIVEGQLLSAKLDNVWIRDDVLCEQKNRLLKGC